MTSADPVAPWLQQLGTVIALSHNWSCQVIMVQARTGAQAIPSGRGVATHGAALPDGNIQAQIQDSSPTWRSVLTSGEVAQAFE